MPTSRSSPSHRRRLRESWCCRKKSTSSARWTCCSARWRCCSLRTWGWQSSGCSTRCGRRRSRRGDRGRRGGRGRRCGRRCGRRRSRCRPLPGRCWTSRPRWLMPSLGPAPPDGACSGPNGLRSCCLGLSIPGRWSHHGRLRRSVPHRPEVRWPVPPRTPTPLHAYPSYASSSLFSR